jgi:hypothetical protein
MANVVKSFSYDLKDASEIASAEDRAKEQGKKFSQYVVDLIKEDLKKKTQTQVAP